MKVILQPMGLQVFALCVFGLCSGRRLTRSGLRRVRRRVGGGAS